MPETAISGVKPAHHRVQAEQLGIDRQREAETGLGLVFLEARPLLHQLHQVPAVRLDHLPGTVTEADETYPPSV